MPIFDFTATESIFEVINTDNKARECSDLEVCLDRIVARKSNPLTLTLDNTINISNTLRYPLQLPDYLTIKGQSTEATIISRPSNGRRTFIGHNLKGAVIRDLTIENETSEFGGGQHDDGGGLHFTSSEVTLDNVRF